MSQSWFISKKKVYVIYYVIKPLLDVIIRPYDVYKCIKMSKVGSFPKKGVLDISRHKTTSDVIIRPYVKKCI